MDFNQDEEQRRKLVEDAVKARRWSIIPQLLAGAGDTLSAANTVYGGPGTGGAQKGVIEGVEGRIKDTSKDFEANLLTDPTSGVSKQYQSLLAKSLGKDPASLANMSAASLKEQAPFLEKLAARESEGMKEADKVKREEARYQSEAPSRKADTDYKQTQIKKMEAEILHMGDKKPDPKEAEAKEKEKEKAIAWDTYQTARKGLLEGLEGTVAGPVMGRLPAVTSKQQIASGGVAAMAPVLKQIFRVAGEGTFTDRDQALLLDMVPTRVDNPAAAKAKIANIDSIVSAKLGRSSGMGESAPAAGVPSVGGTYEGKKVTRVTRKK